MTRGILLAAGAAARFGSNKLLHPLGSGATVVEAAARNLMAAVPDAIAVVRPGCPELVRRLGGLGMDVVVCHDAAQGIGHSVVAGVVAARDADGWVIALGDMPYVLPDTIARLAGAIKTRAAIVAPIHGGERGNPVAFGADWCDALTRLHGDCGARTLLDRHAAAVTLVPVDDPGILRDIDRPGDIVGSPQS
jgi:molybdenum cofactor cytidylyltransferase